MSLCRSCGDKLGRPFLSLGNFPLANSYLTEEELHRPEPCYPLEVYVCQRCFLVQLDDFISAKDIFSSEYAYFSSYSDTWLEHCKDYARMIISRFGLNKDSFVVEIASNDGYLLQYFRERDIPVRGIEPAANTAKVAQDKGIPSDVAFFDSSYAEKMRKAQKLADLIIGNNVLAHNPDLNDFVSGLKVALKPRGIITMEFPHLLKLIKQGQFDTIYHEHFSYFSFWSVKRLFERCGLRIFDAEEIPTHGGSLRIYVRHQDDDSQKISKRIEVLMEKERKAGLLDLEIYHSFGKRAASSRHFLRRFLIEEKDKGKKIVGYGAPAKGNTLLNFCGINRDLLEYTVDLNPYKQNRYLPGSHIPIKHPDRIKEDKPDYLLVLPWNIKDEIVGQMGCIRQWGGRFIVPIPELQLL